MTAFAKDISTVQQLLPVRIDERHSVNGNITIIDKNGSAFCVVPFHAITAHSRAVMIVSAINALQDQLVQRNHHGL